MNEDSYFVLTRSRPSRKSSVSCWRSKTAYSKTKCGNEDRILGFRTVTLRVIERNRKRSRWRSRERKADLEKAALFLFLLFRRFSCFVRFKNERRLVMVVSAPLGLDSGKDTCCTPTISSNVPSAIIRRERSTLVRLKSLTEHNISRVSFICVRRGF